MLHLASYLVVAALAFAVGRGFGARVDAPLSAADMQAETARILAIPSIPDRMKELSHLVGRLDETNASGMGAAVRDVVSSTDANDLRLLIGVWGGFDPQAAFDSVLEWPLESKKVLGAGIVAYEWSRAGGSLAVRHFINGIEQRVVREGAVRGLVQGWAQSDDRSGLAAFVADEKHPETRDKFTELAVNAMLGSNGVDAVTTWVDGIPEDAPDGFKQVAYRKALRQVANRDPEAALKWYSAQAEAEHARRSVPVIAGEWAEHDPEAALAWLRTLPDGTDREVGLHRWITRWAGNDHRAALAWMETADLTGPLASLPTLFVGALLPDHPDVAAKWIDRIPDEALRARATRDLALMWRRTDPEAVAKWLTGRGIDPNSFAPVTPGAAQQRAKAVRSKADPQEGASR